MRLSPRSDVARGALIALAFAGALGAPAATPSFLCTQARTWVEKTICASERLSDLDLELATAYARLLRVASPAGEKSLAAEQQRWWAKRDECRRQAEPVTCLDTRYVARIAELKARPDYTELRPGPVELPPEQLSAVGQGWSKSLSRYLKAIRVCLRRAPAPVSAVTAGWEQTEPDNSVGLRLRGPNDESWVCVARRNGQEVLSLREANAFEPLPAEGPLFYPDPSAPPAGACGKPVQVLDEFDAPVGWVGPACSPVAAGKPAPPAPEAPPAQN
jgi:uncharacterized protein